MVRYSFLVHLLPPLLSGGFDRRSRCPRNSRRTSFREEFAQAMLQLGRISCPAFPDYKHSPAHGPEGFDVPSVPINIPPTLLLPKVRVGGRTNPSILAPVLVPETPVDQDHLAMTRKDNIGRARQVSPVQAEPVAHAMNNPAHNDFGLCVLATAARHTVCPLVFGGTISISTI